MSREADAGSGKIGQGVDCDAGAGRCGPAGVNVPRQPRAQENTGHPGGTVAARRLGYPAALYAGGTASCESTKQSCYDRLTALREAAMNIERREAIMSYGSTLRAARAVELAPGILGEGGNGAAA